MNFIFHNQVQSWHPHATQLHEASLAVAALGGDDAFYAFSAELFKRQEEFFDAPVLDKGRSQIYKVRGEGSSSFQEDYINPDVGLRRFSTRRRAHGQKMGAARSSRSRAGDPGWLPRGPSRIKYHGSEGPERYIVARHLQVIELRSDPSSKFRSLALMTTGARHSASPSPHDLAPIDLPKVINRLSTLCRPNFRRAGP